MKQAFSAMICLLCLALFAIQTACAEQVTISELRQQMPERLQMTVTTKDGKTIEVDAPIVLPDGDSLPVVLVKNAVFDLTDLHKVYPLPSHVTGTGIAASIADDHPGVPHLVLYAEEKNNRLTGKVDSTMRMSLPQGETPPENDVTTKEIMDFIYENMELFDCDAAPDIRILKATAKIGLYSMKKYKTPEGWTEYTIDEKKPVKNASKGIWHLDLAQYMYGVRILGDYFPYGNYLSPDNLSGFRSPTWFHVDYMDEKYFNIIITSVKEVDILIDDAPLLSFEAVKQCLEQRIVEGKLKSIYKLTLGYAGKIVQGDSYRAPNGLDLNTEARFVLVPEWEILGFDEKSAADAKSVGLEEPTKEMILEPEIYSRYGLEYDLRMDAATGKFLLDFESMEYALEQ